MSRTSNYEKRPCVPIGTSSAQCCVGWREIISRINSASTQSRRVLCVECYPGAFERLIRNALEEGLRPAEIIYTPDLLKPACNIDSILADVLGNDPVFGRMNDIPLQSFFDEAKLSQARDKALGWQKGLLLVIGTGAALVSLEPDVLVYADMARWEIQG